ncbi:MAG: hypothetical protein MUF22_09575 [Chitinispirillaceae bacterium]|jgi:hypothetical protein|nr:hypothetical protein [Chitinispirillaceae bacterium]
MTTEFLILALLCSVTLLAYMIAINARSPMKLVVSYFLATLMLGGTVWVIVQHVNLGLDTVKSRELSKLENDKMIAEERARSQEAALNANKEKMAFVARLSGVITCGTTEATTLITVDLQDKEADLETLVARTVIMKKKADSLKKEFDRIQAADPVFSEPMTLIGDGIRLLIEGTQYYQQYYYSEDSGQETLRARIIRQKARNATDKFQKASALLTTAP